MVKDLKQYIEDNTIRVEATRRGGGIEIDLDDLLGSEDGHKMTAYQNYLGGGILGSIQSDYNFKIESLATEDRTRVEDITDALKRYFHDITNEEATDYDDWSGSDYETNQSKPASAY